MRIFIRKILSKFLDKDKKKKIKEFEYKIRKKIITSLPLLTKKDIIDIFINKFKIQKGDNLFIHASLDMIHTELTPLEILNILLDLVGENGSISAPTFIRYSSKEWMLMEKEFDLKKTPSGMGIFSERVRRHKLSSRSLHPTKSIATIGKISSEINNEHHLSKYPFGDKSPFFKLIDKFNVKIIGIGAPMSYLSMVHVIEDIYKENYPINVNEEIIYNKNCITENKDVINVETYVHNLSILTKANPEKFIKKFLDREKFKINNYYLTPFFIVDGKELYDKLENTMKKGITIYD